jgi:hypothetical protein
MPDAHEGKLRAKACRNTQTNSTSDYQAGKSVKAAKVLRLALEYAMGTEATALNSKSTRLPVGHFNAVEDIQLWLLSVDFNKTARSSFFLFWHKWQRRHTRRSPL